MSNNFTNHIQHSNIFDNSLPPATIVSNPELSEPNFDIKNAILTLKNNLNAVILAHYYQDDDIQSIADIIGDSLDLSRKAAATKADTIVFCGVKFMAETAKILSPQKLVLLPDINAGCSLEESCQPTEFELFRKKHPDHIAITYINCSAEIKALSDIICTSTNAVDIINAIPQDQKIIFGPDKNLGTYLNKITGRNMLLWNGTCIVHDTFNEKELVKQITIHPEAKIIAHPECQPELLNYAHHVGSTSSLLKYVQTNTNIKKFIVLTESGIFYKMQQSRPDATFINVVGLDRLQIACTQCNNCPFMRLNTLEKLYLCMKHSTPQITLSSDLITKARTSLDKMLELSK